MKYEIHIGNAFNMDTKMQDSKFKIIITQEQFILIEQFSDIELDAELKRTYIINKCRFTVQPHFDFKAVV